MKKKSWAGLIILIIISSFLAYGCGGSKGSGDSGAGSQAAGYTDITSDQLKSMMEEDKNLLVVDVREAFEWEEGHLDGSVLIPLSEFQSRVSEIPKDKPVVIICASEARSPQVADYLAQAGYPKVYNLKGGLMNWPYGFVK